MYAASRLFGYHDRETLARTNSSKVIVNILLCIFHNCDWGMNRCFLLFYEHPLYAPYSHPCIRAKAGSTCSSSKRHRAALNTRTLLWPSLLSRRVLIRINALSLATTLLSATRSRALASLTWSLVAIAIHRH